MHVKERKSLHKAKIYVRHKIVYFAAEKNITQFCRVKQSLRMEQKNHQ